MGCVPTDEAIRSSKQNVGCFVVVSVIGVILRHVFHRIGWEPKFEKRLIIIKSDFILIKILFMW